MSSTPLQVLILCTGNSARSILAEAIFNHRGAGRVVAYSAGSFPKGAVHPLALALLRAKGWSVEGYRSKSWNEFATVLAPHLDYVLTVCDNAAGEVCPVWPGHPITAHWGIEDPAAAIGSETVRGAAFAKAFNQLDEHIGAFLALPLAGMNAANLKVELQAIGRKFAGSTIR
jgi:arsenate reductase